MELEIEIARRFGMHRNIKIEHIFSHLAGGNDLAVVRNELDKNGFIIGLANVKGLGMHKEFIRVR